MTNKRKPIQLLLICILFLLLLPSILYSKEKHCFIIDGTEEERNGEFTLWRKDILAKSECKAFNSWRKLKKYLDQEQLDPESTKLLILQFAHGSRGGGAHLNRHELFGQNLIANFDSSATIFNTINSIASTYKTAVVIKSCYSGDLLKKKLLFDSNHPAHPAINNLCLWTKSSFTRATRSTIGNYLIDKQLYLENPHKTLEDLYLEEPSGLISSAAWSSTDLDNKMKLLNFSPISNDQYMQEVEQIIGLIPSNILQRHQRGHNLATSNRIDLKLYKQILKLNTGYQKITLSTIEKRLQNKRKSKRKCLAQYRAVLIPHSYYNISDLFSLSNSGDSACNLKKILPLGDPRRSAYKNYENAINHLQEKYSISSLDQASTLEEVLSIISEWSESQDVITPHQQKQKNKALLQSMLGKKLLHNEKKFKAADFQDTTSGQVLGYLFSTGSLFVPEYSSELDQKRREACRSFSLD